MIYKWYNSHCDKISSVNCRHNLCEKESSSFLPNLAVTCVAKFIVELFIVSFAVRSLIVGVCVWVCMCVCVCFVIDVIILKYILPPKCCKLDFFDKFES